MRLGLAALALVAAAGCGGDDARRGADTDESGVNPRPSEGPSCEEARTALQEAKRRRNAAMSDGNPTEGEKLREAVDAKAREARAIPGCDISDLVGANVGQ